ncbi:MAG: DUF1566 domain-containing protein [Bacteroidaceae bacterium]|nr:DUF1566 domain-containing protein [Bacteroidaceae bacterium]
MKRIFAFTLLFQLMLLTAQAQKVEAKKCATCGKPIATCQYKGRHPKPAENKPATNKPAANKPNKPSAPKPTSGNINGHDWVDLGLSVKWATCNVGASKPEDYGGYYAWGETSTKSEYTWGNCFDCFDDSGDSWSVYKIGGKTKLEPNSGHDTARQNWGGTWRMPTIKELEELNSKCTWKWTTKGGHNGYVVTGPNGNMIFLPAAGYRYGTSSYGVGEDGYYWSSTLSSSDSNYAQGLYFDSGNHGTDYYCRRDGQSVRPVTE